MSNTDLSLPDIQSSAPWSTATPGGENSVVHPISVAEGMPNSWPGSDLGSSNLVYQDFVPVEPSDLATVDFLFNHASLKDGLPQPRSPLSSPSPSAAPADWLISPPQPSAPDWLTHPPLHASVQDAIAQLQQFRQSDTWAEDMTLAFGDGWNVEEAQSWLDSLLDPQFWPTVTTLPLADLQAYGAYAPELDRIFLAQELIHSPAFNSLAVDVLLEEVGHWLDHRLNPVDSPGDEGAIFSALVRQQVLSQADLAHLQAENDWATLVWQGQSFAVQQSTTPGLFTVGASGQVTVEFLFDSGAYRGEVGLFSMAGLETLTPGSPEFIAAAVQRALSNSTQGYVVMSETAEGASLSGQLGERSYNAGTPLGPKPFTFQANDTLALLLVPNGSLQSVASNPAAQGDLRPLFSLAAANPLGGNHYGAMTTNANGLVMGIEDVRFDSRSDADFNDVILKLEGVSGTLPALDSLIQSRQVWLTSPLGQSLFSIIPANPTPPPAPVDPITPAPIDPITPAPTPTPTPPTTSLAVALNSDVIRFGPSVTEAQLIASGAARIALGSQTIYVGTNQASAINQNPILASFDAANPANNWVRTDYESTGADGRGNGIAVTPNGNVYAFFSVDGTQGTPDQDFRRASAAAEQSWLRSYGQGGGPSVSVIGQINPTTGELIAAAYLSAVLGNGNSNTLAITGLDLRPNGNLLISARSFFAPRRPNGQPLTLDNDPTTPDSSPFPYFIEITPDLRRVESTSATGWV